MGSICPFLFLINNCTNKSCYCRAAMGSLLKNNSYWNVRLIPKVFKRLVDDIFVMVADESNLKDSVHCSHLRFWILKLCILITSLLHHFFANQISVVFSSILRTFYLLNASLGYLTYYSTNALPFALYMNIFMKRLLSLKIYSK